MARKAATKEAKAVEAEASTARVDLAEVLDLAAAEPLRAELIERRGAPVELDGSAVQRVGGLCLQVLLSAQATWAADGQPLSFACHAPVLRDALMTIGAADMAAGIPEEILS